MKRTFPENKSNFSFILWT